MFKKANGKRKAPTNDAILHFDFPSCSRRALDFRRLMALRHVRWPIGRRKGTAVVLVDVCWTNTAHQRGRLNANRNPPQGGLDTVVGRLLRTNSYGWVSNPGNAR